MKGDWIIMLVIVLGLIFTIINHDLDEIASKMFMCLFGHC